MEINIIYIIHYINVHYMLDNQSKFCKIILTYEHEIIQLDFLGSYV